MRWVDITENRSRAKLENYPYRFWIDFNDTGSVDITVINKHIHEVQDWCKSEFTDSRDRWIWKSSSFSFRDRDDAFMFKIRWG